MLEYILYATGGLCLLGLAAICAIAYSSDIAPNYYEEEERNRSSRWYK